MLLLPSPPLPVTLAPAKPVRRKRVLEIDAFPASAHLRDLSHLMQSTPLHGTELKIDPCCRLSQTLAGARDEIDTGTDEVPTPVCNLALSERQSTPLRGTELEIDLRDAECWASLHTLAPPDPRGPKDVQMVAEIDNEWFVGVAVQVPCSVERMEHARQDG